MTLSWENLTCGYGDKNPLNLAFSGEITHPGIFAIVGPNGCGKSTLLKTWLGLLRPQSGHVHLNGKPAHQNHYMSEGIAYVPQFHRVNSYFQINVADFISQGFGPRPGPKETTQKKVAEVLEQWQLVPDARKSFHELSGGQKTRAMVARAIISLPKILFLDEPLASLDSCCQRLLMETLHDLAHRKNVMVFMIDHHFEPFDKFLSANICFERSHNLEVCTVQIQQKADTCCLN